MVGVATGALLVTAAMLGAAMLGATMLQAGAAKLPPADIQTNFFTGQPFTASTLSGVKFTMVFAPEGKMTRRPVGKGGAKGDGTWKLSDDGFCTSWKGSKPNCYTLVAAGQNKWSVMKGSAAMATWSK
jgi:hypothetical protein